MARTTPAQNPPGCPTVTSRRPPGLLARAAHAPRTSSAGATDFRAPAGGAAGPALGLPGGARLARGGAGPLYARAAAVVGAPQQDATPRRGRGVAHFPPPQPHVIDSPPRLAL